MLSQRSLKLFLFLFTQFFFLLNGSDLHYCFLTDPFFLLYHLMYSRSLLVYFFIYVCFFSGASYIFLLFKKLISLNASILLLNSLIIFTIITLNSFSARLPISRSLSSSCVCVCVCVLIFIYLVALALSCRLQNLWSSFQHADSLVAACKLLVVASGI